MKSYGSAISVGLIKRITIPKKEKELLKLIATNREKLCDRLTEAQKERLECYDDCVGELKGLDECDAFVWGFCPGVRLVAEAFCGL